MIFFYQNQRLLHPSCEWRAMQLTVAGATQSGRRLSTGEPWQKARVCVDKLHRLASVVAASDVGASALIVPLNYF